MSRLSRRSGGRRPQAFVGIDEFSALGADNVLSLLARGRESGVSVLLATQELADLDRAGHGFRDQVLGVTAVKIIHRQDVPASAQMVAQMVGTETVWENTYQIGRGPLGGYSTSRGTRRQVERFLVHPNEIKTLPTGEAVVITKLPTASARIVNVHPPRARGRRGRQPRPQARRPQPRPRPRPRRRHPPPRIRRTRAPASAGPAGAGASAGAAASRRTRPAGR